MTDEVFYAYLIELVTANYYRNCDVMDERELSITNEVLAELNARLGK